MVIYASNLCYTYFSSTRTWTASSALTEARSRAAFTTVASPSNLGIFVAGGISPSGGTLCSVESLNRKSNQWSKASDSTQSPILAPLPVCLHHSCMVQLSPTQILLSGGYNSANVPQPNTYFYNPTTNVWTAGPNLLNYRAEHGCGIVKDSNNMDTVIVAGGWNYGASESTTEIYNRATNTWQRGPGLPYGVASGQMNLHPDIGVVFLGGYSTTTSSFLNNILYLSSATSSWTYMSKSLATRRQMPMVINLRYRDALTTCD